MKTAYYTCNECEKQFDTDRDLLRIGDYDQDNLEIKNPLPGSSMLEMSAYDAIHFCSKECFINFFFKPVVDSAP